MVLPESSDLTVAIRNAVRSLKQLGEKRRSNVEKRKCFSRFLQGQSFEKSKFKGDDLSNIDHVAETLIALVRKFCSVRFDAAFLFLLQGKRNRSTSQRTRNRIDRIQSTSTPVEIVADRNQKWNSRWKSIDSDQVFDFDDFLSAAVIMARESNVTVIQNLQKELDGQLEQVRRFTTQENQLNEAIGALQ